MWECPSCEATVQSDDVCPECALCWQCCECDFTPDELGVDPEEDDDAATSVFSGSDG